MIRDQAIKEQPSAEWEAVEEMLDTARWTWAQVEVVPSILESTRDLQILASNLCVLFATSVLEKVLIQLRDSETRTG